MDHLTTMSDPNWFYYLKYVDGIPMLRDSFSSFKERLEDTKDEFLKVFNEFMPKVKTGMPDLPPSDEVPEEVKEVKEDQEKKPEAEIK